MAVQSTQFPQRPSKTSPPQQQIWTLWQNLQYLANTVFDGFATKFAGGSSSVPATTTSVVVTHSLNMPTYAVKITPTADPGGWWWVTGKTSSQFTLNLHVAAPGGGLPFDWEVKAI